MLETIAVILIVVVALGWLFLRLRSSCRGGCGCRAGRACRKAGTCPGGRCADTEAPLDSGP